MFENSLEWLISQTRVASMHADYTASGRLVASITLNGEAPLVRDLLNRFAELSESGQIERARAQERG